MPFKFVYTIRDPLPQAEPPSPQKGSFSTRWKIRLNNNLKNIFERICIVYICILTYLLHIHSLLMSSIRKFIMNVHAFKMNLKCIYIYSYVTNSFSSMYLKCKTCNFTHNKHQNRHKQNCIARLNISIKIIVSNIFYTN